MIKQILTLIVSIEIFAASPALGMFNDPNVIYEEFSSLTKGKRMSSQPESNNREIEQNKNVLLIGGTGFMGSYVTQGLHRNGWSIALFHRGQTTCEFDFPVTHILGSRQEFLQHKKTIQMFNPAVIVDMIAFSQEDADSLLKTVGDLNCHLVIVSSGDVYQARDRLWKRYSGVIAPSPLKEDSPLRETDFPHRTHETLPDKDDYKYDKKHVESVINQATLYSTILRLPAVYGPRDPYSRVGEYLKRIDNEEPIYVDEKKSHWHFSREYVENIAEAILLATLRHSPGKKIYNVGERKPLTELEWIKAIAHAVGKAPDIRIQPYESLPEMLREPLDFSQNIILDSTLIRQELGYVEKISQEEGLKRTIHYLRNQTNLSL